MSQNTCANIEKLTEEGRTPCKAPAPNVCNGCFLVQYCSKDCQKEHWKLHKLDCKSPMMKETWKPSWVSENRDPTFILPEGTSDSNTEGSAALLQTRHGNRKYLWGNVPAIDMVSFSQNEGKNLPAQFNMLFAASGDVRNMVRSIVGLPEEYRGTVGVILNDRDIDIVARNTILLLVAMHYPPVEAVPMLLHIWYSAFLPSQMVLSLQTTLLPLIDEVCTRIAAKPEGSLQAKTWKVKNISLRQVLEKREWDRLSSYLKVPEGLSANRARSVMVATTWAPERQDYIDRAFYTRPPHWRVCAARFRRDGIILPFGEPREEFNVPNPTFFQTDFWPMMDSADPIEGWQIEEVLKMAPLAKNDLYGSLYFYLLELLKKFTQRLENIQANFQLFQVDAKSLPPMITGDNEKQGFDRIEVSNICDRGYLGPRLTLSCFAPLLKPKALNPHATILFLFINVVHEEIKPLETLTAMQTEVSKLQKYIPTNPALFANSRNPDFHLFNDARALFRDFDKYFDRFVKNDRLSDIGKASGMRMKNKHTIVERWPLRIKKNATTKDFKLHLGSTHFGGERYVEWERVE